MPQIDPITPAATARRRTSLAARIAVLAVLTISLQIPIGMIGGTIAERQMRRDEAAADVTASWGGVQTVRGPFLVVPYVRRWTETIPKPDGSSRTITRESSHGRYVL